MWCSERRRLIAGLGALPLALAGCGFSPLYGSGGPAEAMIGRIDVAPIDGSAGFALRERLIERLGPPAAPTHRLEVDLELIDTGVALTEEDITTRFNVIGAARFELVPLGSGDPVVIDSVRVITGYSAPDTASAFAVLTAEQDAARRLGRTLADRITQRLALRAPDWLA